MSMRSCFRTFPLVTLFSKAEQEDVMGHAAETRYPKGTYIFREGDPAESFHVVKEGAVKCVKTSTEGRDITLKVLMPGDLFCCEAAVFDGSSHPGCAQALEDTTVIKLHKKVYFDLLRQNPEAALEVIGYLGSRLRESQENAKAFALDRADQRVAAVLVNLAERAGIPDAEGVRLSVRVTRRDLADMTGLTLETTIRIIGRFKRLGFLMGTAKRLIVKDLSGLRRLGGSDVFSPPPH